MYSFCPHCGETIGQDQRQGHTLMCRYCGKLIGVVASPQTSPAIDEADALLRSGAAARCPVCGQLVQIKAAGAHKSLVPHQGLDKPPKMCPGGGKPLTPVPVPAATSPIQRPVTSKDLSAYVTRENIKVVACLKSGAVTIEELTLEYLDKSDRVRLQIDALRSILGAQFRMQPYPARLNRPDLAMWGNAAAVVVAQRHPQGGFQPMQEAVLRLVMADMQQHTSAFFETEA